MNVMFARLWDLGEDASDELEDIEGLSVGMVEQAQLGIVVYGLALVEEGGCALGPMDARQREGTSQHVTAEPLETIGVLRPNGRRSVDRETAISK